MVDHKSVDTAGAPPTELVNGEKCEVLDQVTTVDGVECWVYSADERTGVDDFGDRMVQESKITVSSVGAGDNTSAAYPGSNAVKWGRERLDTTTAYWSDSKTAFSGSTGSWEIGYSPAETAGVNGIPNDAAWVPMIHIADTSASSGVCAAYAPLTVCYDYVASTSQRTVPEDSTCAAGSGTFQLTPVQMFDNDEDGDITALLASVQSSGTGTMTEAAWITSALMVEDQGAQVRISKDGYDLGVSATDLLENASTVSYVIAGGGSTFGAGDVRGGALFVVQELDGETPAEFEVELEWECGSVSTYASAPSGYEFDSNTLADCVVDFPQRFVVRPRFEQGVPTALRVMAYGRLGQWLTVPVTQVGNTHVFELEHLGLVLSGTVDDWSPEALDLTFDTLSWEQVDLCEPDSVSLPASE